MTQPNETPADEGRAGSADFRNLSIRLTKVEDTLRRLLLDVADFIQDASVRAQNDSTVVAPDQLRAEKTVLRFTGGWVRDKLLGVESHDIDVAINNMTGYQFGLQMKDYLETPGALEKYGLSGIARTDAQSENAAEKPALVGGLHKIEANPEKSKHLETVTTRILGLDIDLVNLRKETYTDESRNPQMEFGTPEEDALRRDATINAMFFNLNTLKIEDFTTRGFDDMQAKLIRTPLEPYQTFRDDPLRILRLIRFASRLGYTVDPDAEQAMRNEDIRTALKIKISRERVGVELEKTLRGPGPLTALKMIHNAGLYTTIFWDSTPNAITYEPETKVWSSQFEQTATILDDRSGLGELLIHDAEERYQAWVLACLVPFSNAPAPETPPGKKVPPPIASNIAREGFKAPNRICDIVTASVRNASEISFIISRLGQRDTKSQENVNSEDVRSEVGMLIRKWGPSWRVQTVFALLAELQDKPDDFRDLTSAYEFALQRINTLGIQKAYDFKPLIDGKQMAKAMGLSPGPWMKPALEIVMAWQLRSPNNTNVADAVEQVKLGNIHGELSADLIDHLLRLIVRPLFAKNRPQAVTEQGRRNDRNMGKAIVDISVDEERSKPWKKPEHQVVAILTWAIMKLDDELVETYWHLIVPPLLSMVDDSQMSFKSQGCELITSLLNKTPRGLLIKTGLFNVFQDALITCLGFLPTLTPVEESARLLRQAFPALLLLHQAYFDGQANPRSTNDIDLLDNLLRKGVLSIYSHCPEIPQILAIVLRNLAVINDALGLESIKHLKLVLPMLNEILCNPFGPASPELLEAALQALQSVIRNGWPRMEAVKGEVLKGLSVCWINVSDADHQERFTLARKEAKVVVDLLREAVDGVDSDFQALMDADDRLGTLFL